MNRPLYLIGSLLTLLITTKAALGFNNGSFNSCQSEGLLSDGITICQTTQGNLLPLTENIDTETAFYQGLYLSYNSENQERDIAIQINNNFPDDIRIRAIHIDNDNTRRDIRTGEQTFYRVTPDNPATIVLIAQQIHRDLTQDAYTATATVIEESGARYNYTFNFIRIDELRDSFCTMLINNRDSSITFSDEIAFEETPAEINIGKQSRERITLSSKSTYTINGVQQEHDGTWGVMIIHDRKNIDDYRDQHTPNYNDNISGLDRVSNQKTLYYYAFVDVNKSDATAGNHRIVTTLTCRGR